MIFQQNDFDYSKVVNSNPNSIITPGIEFCQKETLHRLWQYHKDLTLISDIIFKGVDYPCKSAPSEEERLSDLEFMINRVNHPSAKGEENSKAVLKIMKKKLKKDG